MLGILCKLGEYFQVQDDYLDCFGDESVIGKVGTDIRDNKCSWLIITALELVSPEQMDILRKNYGRKDDSCQDQVKQVYRDLDLPRYYREYEEMSYANIMNMIQQVDEDKLPRRIFHDILEMIYKRDK